MVRTGDSQPSALALFLLLTLGAVIAFIVVEVTFRLFMVPIAQPGRVNRERPRTYFLPESLSLNRDRLYSARKPKNTVRLTVVGDSFTFGPHLQFDDTFPKRLERWLNLNNDAPRVEVINLGNPGYSTADQVSVVRKAAVFTPDILLLEITLNDAEDRILTKEERDLRFGNPYANTWLLRHWKSMGFIVQRFFQSRGRMRTLEYFKGLFDDPALWRRFVDSLAEMKMMMDKKEIKFVATIFPLFGYSLDENYPYHETHKKIANELQRLNIPYLDLFSAFKGLRTERLETIPGVDPHPNEIAHRIAAEALYRWLKRDKLLSAEVFAKKHLKSRERISKELSLFK